MRLGPNSDNAFSPGNGIIFTWLQLDLISDSQWCPWWIFTANYDEVGLVLIFLTLKKEIDIHYKVHSVDSVNYWASPKHV